MFRFVDVPAGNGHVPQFTETVGEAAADVASTTGRINVIGQDFKASDGSMKETLGCWATSLHPRASECLA